MKQSSIKKCLLVAMMLGPGKTVSDINEELDIVDPGNTWECEVVDLLCLGYLSEDENGGCYITEAGKTFVETGGLL